MHIAITNRVIAEKVSALIKTPHAIISITDPDSEFPRFSPNENHLGILSQQFYDIEDISDEMSLKDAVEYVTIFGHGLFKDDQAAEIVDFVERIKDKAKGILVHCEAGVSRSAAVAAVIELILNGSNERVLQDHRYSPNQYVYTKLLLAWQKKSKGSLDPLPRTKTEGLRRGQILGHFELKCPDSCPPTISLLHKPPSKIVRIVQENELASDFNRP